MTAELRYIYFSSAEFTRALRDLAMRCKEDVPTMDIVTVKGIDEKTGEVTLGYSGDSIATLAREKAAAALILFCRTRKIPLPAEGQKSLTVSQGRIVLVVSITDKARQLSSSAVEGAGPVPAA